MKHFIEVIFPGLLHCSSSEQEIEERNPNRVELPEGAEGFRFFDKNEAEEKINYSGWYYVGKAYTLEEVENLFSEEGKEQFLKSMRRNNWSCIVKTCQNSCYPLRKNDTVIE